ncbi:hypothetical protein E2542_SST17200 [Spatholobus suberectus]|nr:hypothetical protein E2542_SST17200 [Spatholobus suberectus]
MKKEAKKNSRIDDTGSPEDAAHYIQTEDSVKDNTNQSRKKVKEAITCYYGLFNVPTLDHLAALCFVAVAAAAALVGQHLVRKAIAILGRASVIIFILTLTLSVSAVLLGGVGVAHMIQKIENKEYMGFGNLCTYGARK